MKKIRFSITDTFGDTHPVEVPPHAYRSLMDFIADELFDEIGDCRGRAWCGTCIVKQIRGDYIGTRNLSEDEMDLLAKYPNPDGDHIRLACQIQIDAELENTAWIVVDSRLEM